MTINQKKKMEMLEKFRDSLFIQIERAKKSIGNISFKNSGNCTFEDFRDSQFNDEKKITKKNENIRKYKRFKSSKYNNYIPNRHVKDLDNNNHNIINNRKNKSKNNSKKNNVIKKNDFEDILDVDEKKKQLIDLIKHMKDLERRI